MWYEGAGTATRRWLHADERGSVVAVSDAGGNAIAVNRYDEYGIPAAGNLGRFGYTGQMYFPEYGLYHYKARTYSPTLGRFLQTDPIGYGDGPNLYNYAGGDPVNNTDPEGESLFAIVKIIGNAVLNLLGGKTAGVSVSTGNGRVSGSTSNNLVGPPRPTNDGPVIIVNGPRPLPSPSGSSNASLVAPGVFDRGGSAPPLIYGPPVAAAAQVTPCKGGVDCSVKYPCNVTNNFSGSKPEPVYERRLFGTNYCGVGGEGPITGRLDEACRVHDRCYGASGLTAGSNFSPFRNEKLRQCNQRLCDGSRGTGTPGRLVRLYFTYAPTNGFNGCN